MTDTLVNDRHLCSRFSLFVCLFVYSRLSNFSAIRRLSPLPVTGLQILAYARRSGPLNREGSLSCHTNCDTGPRFIRSHPKDRHPRPTVGFEPPMQGSSDHCARCSNHCATQATLTSRNRQLNGAVFRMRPEKPRPPCHCPKAPSAEHSLAAIT